jgi:hypothetical protein
MTLSMNEIRARCARFSDQWKDASDEHAEAKSFWDALFEAFGANRRQLARYEHPVKLPSGSTKFIDVLWKTKLLVEQKSRGKNLDDARSQGQDYIPYLPADARPRYLVVSDFARFDVEDLHTGERHQFRLEELADNAAVLGFLGGYQPRRPSIEAPVNIQAVELLGDLHDALKEGNYPPHDLERLLVRILFCFFAEDTGLFDPDEFSDYVVNRTREDGSDLGSQLEQFFTVLDTPKDERQKHLDEALVGLPYVNGNVFSGRLAVAAMNKVMHEALLRCVDFDWSKVHPGIFGSLFQGVMDTKERRAVGAHYTSEENILRLINPLFMDSLRTEFAAIKNDRSNRRAARLDEFHRKLADLRFLDPACGCGNFLVIAYREVRRLEIEVLKEIYGEAQQITDIALLSRVSVTSFYGIEIGEFACAIAKVAMWFMEHIMNTELSFAFGRYFVSLPLVHSAQIVHANSLRTDWKELLPPSDHVVVFGNPPFVGAKYQTQSQREDIGIVAAGVPNSGLLDYVAGWYFKAADYIQGSKARCALVSTNSITQGEQVSVLWPSLLEKGLHINFAHRTFAWESEARGKAHVHVVIIGFAAENRDGKRIFDHSDGAERVIDARRINPYLVDAPMVTVGNRSSALCSSPKMGIGNKPIDGGSYLFTPEEKREFLQKEPAAAEFFIRWMGSEELINGIERWCLCVRNVPPEKLRTMPEVMRRVEAVAAFRAASNSEPTRKLAKTPTRFHVENFPSGKFLAIPGVSSERRPYIPIQFLGNDTLASNLLLVVSPAAIFDFGILSSVAHMAWMRLVAGRLKSDYRYSVKLVYNNFPWPEPSASQRRAVEAAAQGVLDSRAEHPSATLADLYDPRTMPPNLAKAHVALDLAVDRCYRSEPFTSEPERVEFLFALYDKLTVPLATSRPTKKPRKKKAITNENEIKDGS